MSEMTKVLLNSCHAEWDFSEEFRQALITQLNYDDDTIIRLICDCEIQERSNPELIALFEEFGPERANGKGADLKLALVHTGYIETGTASINEYMGQEHININHPQHLLELIKQVPNLDEQISQIVELKKIRPIY